MEGEFPGSELAPESGADWEGLDSMISEFWVILGLSEAVPAEFCRLESPPAHSGAA